MHISFYLCETAKKYDVDIQMNEDEIENETDHYHGKETGIRGLGKTICQVFQAK